VVLGLLMLVGAAGYALFAIAPKGQRFPEPPAPNAGAFLFTPHGPDSPELMLMEPLRPAPPPSRARRTKPGA
jgi:hypothetical protein